MICFGQIRKDRQISHLHTVCTKMILLRKYISALPALLQRRRIRYRENYY